MDRYALYYVPPPETALAAFGARWLARWSPRRARRRERRGSLPLARKYGFHATLKAPSGGGGRGQRRSPMRSSFCRTRGRAGAAGVARAVDSCPRPNGRSPRRSRAECVRIFIPSGALTAEIARRRRNACAHRRRRSGARLPTTMEDFRFHLTLTGALTKAAGRGSAPDARACSAIASLVEMPGLPVRPGVAGSGFRRTYCFALERPPQR